MPDHTMDLEDAPNQCRKCRGRIKEGDEYARGAYGYDYLCEQCYDRLLPEAEGVTDDE